MSKWLGVLLMVATSSVAAAQQDLLQQICETTALNQELTVSVGTPTIIAHHRNGRMIVGEQNGDIDVSQFTSLLVGDNQVSDDCLAYLQHRNILRVTSSSEKVEKGEPIFARVFFHFDRAELSQTSQRILDHIATQLKANPNLVTLEGHTDARGNEEYNLALGLRRSKAVEQYLIDKGIDAKNLQATSQGEAQPIADNATQLGREKNRRVEVKA